MLLDDDICHFENLEARETLAASFRGVFGHYDVQACHLSWAGLNSESNSQILPNFMATLHFLSRTTSNRLYSSFINKHQKVIRISVSSILASRTQNWPLHHQFIRNMSNEGTFKVHVPGQSQNIPGYRNIFQL